MTIQPISSILDTVGLREPEFDVLTGDASKYKVLMLQPQGNLSADITGVRHYDNQLATQQFNNFLNQAFTTQPELVIAPEYATPWESLTQALFQSLGPSSRKLWVLGCEGLRYGDLPSLKSRFEQRGIEFLYETPPAPDDYKFVSPVCYIFVTHPLVPNQPARTVVLVQFKTQPMSGTEYERDCMVSGTLVYKFGGNSHIKLLTLICADALVFSDMHAATCYDRTLILHLQLNPRPRHNTFHICRYRLLQYAGDETEIICLNWAKGVRIHENGIWHDWNRNTPASVPNSAWHLKSKQCDIQDASVNTNHKLGLYYTWSETLNSHTLLLNYQQAVYLFETTKVAHGGVVAPASKRTGPKLKRRLVWDVEENNWLDNVAADDGFGAVVSQSGGAATQLQAAVARGALEAERLLALGTGRVNGQQWHSPRNLDACVLDSDEAVRRVTFALDTEQEAIRFREARLGLCAGLWHILNSSDLLPSALSDLRDGFDLTWDSSFPHQNVVSITTGKRATIVYMGGEVSDETATKAYQKLEKFLETSLGATGSGREALQRLTVWRRNAVNSLIQIEANKYIRFDRPDTEGAVSITEI